MLERDFSSGTRSKCEFTSTNNLPQALKHLRSIQVINFGDCLVRPAGATAIAESVSNGLPILKVNEKRARVCRWSFSKLLFDIFLPLWISNPLCLTGTQSVIWRDYRRSCSGCGTCSKGQGPARETGLKWYKPAHSTLNSFTFSYQYFKFLFFIIVIFHVASWLLPRCK